jgi:histidinol-phosphatase
VSVHRVSAVALHAVAGYSDDLRLAHVLADGADDITTKRFRALDLDIETKPDLTPVSDADRSVEEQIRGTLKRARPARAASASGAGSSTRSTPPRTSSAASRCGPR